MAYGHWLFFLLVNCCTISFCVQANHTVAVTTRPPWYCHGDICNINGVHQYCSRTYLKCIDCYEIRHTCFTEDMPLNCTNACKEYTLEQLKEYTLKQLKVAEMTCKDPPTVWNGKCLTGYILIALVTAVVSSVSTIVFIVCCRKCRSNRNKPGEPNPKDSSTEAENKLEEEQPTIRLKDMKHCTQSLVPNLPFYLQNGVEKETVPLLNRTDHHRHQSNNFDGNTEQRSTTEGRNPNTGDNPMNGHFQFNLNISSNNQNQVSVIDAHNSSTNISPNAASASNNGDPPNNDENNDSNTPDESTTAQQPQESVKYPTMETQKHETEPKNILTQERGATGGAHLGFVQQQESNEQDLNRKVTVGQGEIQMGDQIGANNTPNGNIPPNEMVPSCMNFMHLT